MRFFGKVGYGESQESLDSPGVWEDVITEVEYTGDVGRAGTNTDPSDNVHNDLKVNNLISVVADQKLIDDHSKIRFVEWNGVCWEVSSIELRPPRILLNLGKVYNGPRQTT